VAGEPFDATQDRTAARVAVLGHTVGRRSVRGLISPGATHDD
jgi:hypothetical protein